MRASDSRWLLILALCIPTPMAYVVVFQLFDQTSLHREGLSLHATNLVLGLLFAVAWTRIWIDTVRWTYRRWVLTLVVFVIAACVAVIAGIALNPVVRDSEFAVVIGGIFWLPTWIVGTTLLWRETAAERAARVGPAVAAKLRCPACGYSLTGLREARCPECGRQYTLDELFGAIVADPGETTT